MSPSSSAVRPRGHAGHRSRRLAAAAVATLAVLAATVALASGTAQGRPAHSAAAAAATEQVPVPLPPMGWASWNTFAAKINYGVIKAQADALVSSGLAAAGYRYVNIDEGWWQGARDSAGNITVDTAEWPGGMKAIADYLHGRGLLAGIYTDAGRDGCGYYYPTGRPAAPGSGSEGHYAQDMLQFSRWGFDFVKVDWCGGDAEGLKPDATYRSISTAVNSAAASTGRPLVLSICNWGVQNPWNWAPGLGRMWRTSTDIIFYGQTATQAMVLTNFDQGLHPTAQHTGYYNDPDMMIAGMPNLTAAQNRTHLNLWAVSGAPLLLGDNIATMDAGTASLLKNKEVLAIDQDPRGLQGVKVAEDVSGRQVFSKVLTGSGRRAVVLLNRTSATARMTVRWADLGLTDAAASVRNLWTGQDVGSFASGYSVDVPANDSVLLTVSGTDVASSTYQAQVSGSTAQFTGVGSAGAGFAVAGFAYTNSGSTTRTATLQVNSQPPTAVALPPTGGAGSRGNVSVIVSLTAGNANTFNLSSGGAADIQAVEVLPLSGSAPVRRVIRGVGSQRCLDVNNASTANGTQLVLWDCTGAANQTWTYTADKRFVGYGDKCLDAYGKGTTNGTAVAIWDCNGQPNQQWNVNADGTISGVQSGLCVDATGGGTANGTKIILWTCGSAANQRWSLG